MTYNVLIFGLILLAALLPLAAIPLAIVVGVELLVVADVAPLVDDLAPPAPRLAVAFLRAPPSL